MQSRQQQQNQFAQGLASQRQLAFAGLSQEDKLRTAERQQQHNQFGRSLEEQMAGRVQQGEQFGEQMVLDRDRLEQQGSQFDRSLTLDEAGLTGMYEGQETQQAQQQFLENERARMAQLVSAVEGLGDEEQRASFARRLMSEGTAQGRFEGVADVLYNPSYRVGNGGGGGGGGGVRPVYSTAPGGTTVGERTVNPRTLSQEEYDEYERQRRLNRPAAAREW